MRRRSPLSNLAIERATIVGTVQDVSGYKVSITLSAERFSGLSFVRGQGYRVGQVGSFVRIPLGYSNLYGIVSQVGASAAPQHLLDSMQDGHRWMTVHLFGEGNRSGHFSRGVSQYPTIGDEAHLVSESDLSAIYGARNKANHLVRIGHIAGSESIDALLDINKLVTRHSAIVGSTGSGKSTTVATLMNVLSDPMRFPSARIVILDTHGEYAKALADRANVFKVNPDEQSPHEHSLCVPFWALSFDEMLDVTFGSLPPDSKARNVIMERVIDAKKDSLTRGATPGITEENVTADSPVPFSLHKLWYDLYCIEFGTYYSSKGSHTSRDNWAFETDASGTSLCGNAERGIPPRFKKVKNDKDDPEKIQYIPDGLNIRGPLESLGAKLRVSRYDFLLRAEKWHPDLSGKIESTLADLIQAWLGKDRPVTILDLSGIPSSLVNQIVGVVLRVLYDALFWSRNLSEGGRERPLLIVMEEAHTYLNSVPGDSASEITKRIVKEGRKYGIGAMIVSQRPSELDSTILSQCGTLFALRLSNGSDRAHVNAALPDNLEGLTGMLPVLRTGEAIVIGEAVNIPMRTMVQAPSPDLRPDSQDPVVSDHANSEFSLHPGGWNPPRPSNVLYSEVTEVWLRQDPKLRRTQEGD